jgi:hypothetical protein
LLQTNIVLLQVNRQQIAKIQRSSNIALKERYQLNENVRTVRVFNVLTVVISIANLFTCAMVMVIVYVFTE